MQGNNRIDMWLMSHSNYFRPEHMASITDLLSRLPEDKANLLLSLELKDPTTILLFSIFLGELGVDRFMLGHTGLGIAKLLTCGGCGIWWIVDMFIISGRARDYNYQLLVQHLGHVTTTYDQFPLQ